MTADLAATLLTARRVRWVPAITADGTAARPVGEVAEFTDRVDLSGWPPGTRLLVRRDVPHPGAQLTFTDVHGYHYQCTLTNLADRDVACVEALHRGRGRCVQTLRDLKDTGLAHRPSASFALNQAWLTAVLMAADQLAWCRGLCWPTDLQQAQPPRLRYRLLHTVGRIVRSGRRATVKLARGWPWADVLVAAFQRCAQITPA